MNKEQKEQLEIYLWRLTRAIGDNIIGLPENWLENRNRELDDIFRSEK